MKNTMKIFVPLLFAIFLFSLLMFSASAAETTEVRLTLYEPIITVNGIEYLLDVPAQYIDTAGMIVVPLQAVAEAFNAAYYFDSETLCAEIQLLDGSHAAFTVGNTTFYINGVERTLDLAPTIVDGRVLVRPRPFSEIFGCDIVWEDETRTIIFTQAVVTIPDSGTCGDNLTWTFDKDNGHLTISGTGEMWYMYPEYPWENLRGAITTLTVNEGVTSIGTAAFSECINLVSVDLPDSLRLIGADGFAFCEKLTEVTIPAGVTDFGGFPFSCCYELTEIKVVPENPYYVAEDGILFNKDKTELIAFPAGKQMTEYTIPDTVTEIYAGAFAGSRTLEKIIMPAGISQLFKNEFQDCPKLTSISVSLDNQSFVSENGILFSKDKKTLIRFPQAIDTKLYIVPESVETIKWFAFESSNNLESVIIPEGVTTIEMYAFYNCQNLKSITIPESVTSIGEWGFVPYPTIRCFENSVAHSYAVEHNIPFELITDTSITESEASEDDIYVMGAQLRLDAEDFKTDMRFVIRISKDFLDANGITEYEGENVKFGSLVLPFENGYMKDGDKLSCYSATSEGWRPASVPAVNKFKEDETYVYYTVCLTDIAVYERYYAVRPYVMISDTEYIYGNQYQAANLHNVCVLAAEDFATRGGVPAAITNIFYKCGHDEIIGKFNDNEVSLPWQF